MKASVFFNRTPRSVVASLLKEFERMNIDASAVRLSDQWPEADGEEMNALLEGISHFIISVDREKPGAGWISYLAGYTRGAGRSTCIYRPSASRHIPAYLSGIPVIAGTDELADFMGRERESYQHHRAIMEARLWLQNHGYGFSNSAFAAVVKDGNAEAARHFLAAGFATDTCDDRGVPVLSVAIRSRHTELINLLIDRGADINHLSDDRGNTPLMEAAVKGDEELVSYLIGQGAELNFQNKSGQTALMLAVGEGYGPVAARLIESGADLERVDQLGMTAYKYAKLFNLSQLVKMMDERRTAQTA